MAAELTRVKPAEHQILDILQDEASPLSPAVVTNRVKASGITESDIFSAIWFLIDRGKVRLTVDLKLQAV